MKRKISIFILDYIYGVMKRYVGFLRAYCLAIGIYVLLINGSANHEWMMGIKTVIKSDASIEHLIQSGEFYELVLLVFLIGWIWASIIKVVELTFNKREKYDTYTDFIEMVSVYFIITLLMGVIPEVTIWYIAGIVVVYFVYGCLYGLLGKIFKLELKYVLYKKVVCIKCKSAESSIPYAKQRIKCDEVIINGEVE